MFFIEDRINVEFDELDSSGKCSELFKKSLLFDDGIKGFFLTLFCTA